MKACSKCGKSKELGDFHRDSACSDGHVGVCKACKALYHSKYYGENRGRKKETNAALLAEKGDSIRARNNAYTAKFPKKQSAQNAVKKAIKSGVLVRQPCEDCGGTEHIRAHHDDYNRPLEVRWLCASHHSQWHSKHGEGENG